MTQSTVQAGKVFVAGGLPTVTYNPRAQFRLENQVYDYLDERHRILSVSGPTKTGKTVLIRNVLKDGDAIWASGGSIRNIDDLWAVVADELDLDTAIETSRQNIETQALQMGAELNVGVAKVATGGQDGTSWSAGAKAGRVRPLSVAARKALRTSQTPLVIDDFHYIPADVQIEIVRSVKDLVFDGVPVIVIAVPHRAYDVIRVEKEMTGRVQQLPIGVWSNDELSSIAEKGFQALNVLDEYGTITARLAHESFASPHLMQDFCLQVVKDSGYRTRQDEPALLQEPQWQAFFEDRSTSASKTAFDLLVAGPRQRTDRKRRELKDGLIVDIYGAVLMAIGHTGPLTTLKYETLRAAMREIAHEPPRGHEIGRILDEMSKIAKGMEGEPVVDYDSKLSTLHISDPYFAFFLRWRAKAELSERAHGLEATFSPASAGKARIAAVSQSAKSERPTEARGARGNSPSRGSKLPRKYKYRKYSRKKR